MRFPHTARSSLALALALPLSMAALFSARLWAQDGAPGPRREDSTVAAITAGDDFACARTVAGSIRCWGANAVGQLGDGTTLDRAEPVTVASITDAVDVSAGRYHACAVRADRSVWCWGDAARACFDPGRGGVRALPSRVHNAPASVRVFAGDAHTCALTDTGEVSCWGEGIPGHEPVAPTAVEGIHGATDVATTGDSACARLPDGAVACWSVGTSMRALPLEGVDHVARLFAAAGVCAVRQDHSAVCGRPVPDAARGVYRMDSPVNVSSLGRVAQTSGGARAACALDDAGSVKCWGAWDDPEGASPNALTALPRGVSMAGAGPATMVAVGTRHACALGRDGTIRCWGANTVGQLGDGTAAYRSTAAEVPGVVHVESLGLGSDVSCAVLHGGTASCWGRNNNGALGDGTLVNRRAPAAVVSLAGAVQIAPVGDHACARMRNGTVRCWGTSRASEVARTGAGTSMRPVAVRGLRGVRALDGAYTSVCALQGNGSIQCVGDTGGFATEPVAGATGFTQAAVGRCVYDPYACGVRDDGTVACSSTAGGAHGELGAGTSRPLGVVTGVAGATQVAAGVCYACATARDGSVACWGEEPDGRAVLPDDPAGESHGVRAVPELGDVEQVAAGDHHACARRRDGTVWCWGNNQYGQLGDGTREGRSRPVQVAGVTDAVEIAAGERHSCARLRDGSVWCWGENHWGQLGDGAPAGRAEPAAVHW